MGIEQRSGFRIFHTNRDTENWLVDPDDTNAQKLHNTPDYVTAYSPDVKYYSRYFRSTPVQMPYCVMIPSLVTEDGFLTDTRQQLRKLSPKVTRVTLLFVCFLFSAMWIFWV